MLVTAADPESTGSLDHGHFAEQYNLLSDFDSVDEFLRDLGQREKGDKNAKVDFGREAAVHAGQVEPCRPVEVSAGQVSALDGFS